MSPVHPRPPRVADERTQLLGWLDLQRQLVRWKCEGLSEDDAHRAVLPPSPLMTMAGLVSHPRWTEHCWFEVVFLDREQEENPQFLDEPEDADWRMDDVPLARLLDEYERQWARSNEIVAAHALDDPGAHELALTAAGAVVRPSLSPAAGGHAARTMIMDRRLRGRGSRTGSGLTGPSGPCESVDTCRRRPLV